MSRRPNRKALTPHQRISKWIAEGRLAEGAGGCIRRSSSDGSRVCRTCARENGRKSDAKRRRRYMTREKEAS